MPKKILILTVHHGLSHERVARALQTALLNSNPRLVVEVADALEHSAMWFRLYYDSYQIPLQYWPALWARIEDAQHRGSATSPRWLYRLGGRPFFQFVRAFDPDVLVATEVGTCELAALMKREMGAKFLLVGVPTGLDADRPWSQPEVSVYIVAVEEVAAELEAAGVSHERIRLTGQPVPPAVAAFTDRAALRPMLGVKPELPLILVLFGGMGVGRPGPLIAALGRIEPPAEFVLIAGKNRRLKEHAQRLARVLSNSRVLGWVENMGEWMAASDLVISKPGASTIVEALNAGVPLLALDPLPGNERRACDWIEKHRVGVWLRKAAEIAPTVARLLAHPDELAEMRRNALLFARPRAACHAAKEILNLLEPGG